MKCGSGEAPITVRPGKFYIEFLWLPNLLRAESPRRRPRGPQDLYLNKKYYFKFVNALHPEHFHLYGFNIGSRGLRRGDSYAGELSTVPFSLS